MPALLIEGKVDEVAQGAADTALTYADPVPQFKTVKRVEGWWNPSIQSLLTVDFFLADIQDVGGEDDCKAM